jgi:predicted DNA-binding protein YlxM (UPF0122 family)
MAAPSKLTDENRVKLMEAASLDASVEEMAYLCNVTKQTVYNWFKEDQALFDEIERLRAKPVLLARKTVFEKLPDSYANAMDFLKRKKRAEFGDNVDMTSDGEKITFTLLNEVANKYGTNPVADTGSPEQKAV